MPMMLFKLNGVPADEADEVRQLLSDNNVPFYETSAGNWGVSLAAIWLNEESQFEKAKQLLDQYQRDRKMRMQHLYKQDIAEKNNIVFITSNPLRFIFYIIFILFIIYISTMPFINFSEWLAAGSN